MTAGSSSNINLFNSSQNMETTNNKMNISEITTK